MLKRFGNQQGLTLIEIIVSLAILGIIIVPIYTMFIISVKVDVNAKDQMIANQLAQQAMEKAKINPIIQTPLEIDGYTVETTIADGFPSAPSRYKFIEPTPIIIGEKVRFNGTDLDLEESDPIVIEVENTRIKVGAEEQEFEVNKNIDLCVYYDADPGRNITIANNTSFIVNLYIFSSSTAQPDVTVDEGTVYTYPTDTAWDPTSTVREGSVSIVDQITITVSKTTNGVKKDLAEIVGLRNNY